MGALGVTSGDTVEVIGKLDGIDAKCYPLLPSDEDQGVTRIDPDIRKIIGVSVEDTVTVRNLATVPDETIATNEPAAKKIDTAVEESATAQEVNSNSITSEGVKEGTDETTTNALPIFILSGSCHDFEKERPKLMEFVATLESAAHSKSNYKCYSDGKKALGWDFFLLEVDQKFVEKLYDLYPAMHKEEADTPEERFALWMNKRLKKMKLDFHVKLSDVLQEKVRGFRLDPTHFKDKTGLEDLR
jgi:hypothetical protein